MGKSLISSTLRVQKYRRTKFYALTLYLSSTVLLFFLNHQYIGTPVSINTTPIAASRGREKMVFTMRTAQNKITTAGTIGYPQTLYGRGASGIFLRNIKTPNVVAP